MRAIPVFFFFNGVREIIPIYPLYAIMFTESGVSAFELSVLFSIWAAVGIVFEVPSGALADRFSRKWLIVISSAFKSAGFISWFLFPDLAGYALGFVLWGLGSTLRSGTWEALLFDLLAHHGRDAEFGRLYGRIMAVGTAGVVLGELSGGILISQGYDVVLLVSAAIPLLASVPFALFVKEPPKKTRSGEDNYLAILRDGLKEAVGSRSLLFIVLTYAGLIVTFGVYDEYSAPTLREKGFSLAAVAYLSVLVLLAQSIGQWLAGRFASISLGRLFVMIAASASTLMVVPFVPGFIVVPVLAIFFFMFGLSMTLFQDRLQHTMTGENRATVTSVVGMADGIGAIVWFLAFGVAADLTSMSEATAILGA